MSEEASEIVKADETPEPEDPKKSQEEVTADPAEPKPSRVKITEVAKQMTECGDCKKPMNMKTLRYSHPDKCEGKPSDIMSKPVFKKHCETKSESKAIKCRKQ